MISGFKVFYRNVFQQLKTTGSIAPSSRALAEAMIRMVVPKKNPLAVLEAGPGTGPFTLPLIHKLGQEDRLDLCELNPEFVTYLKQVLQADPTYLSRRETVILHQQAVQNMEGENKYDYIVSSLPFNNFEPDLVQTILDSYMRMIKPGGLLSFFEYAYCRDVKGLIGGAEEKDRMRQVGDMIQAFVERHAVHQELVMGNLPPARVYVNQLK